MRLKTMRLWALGLMAVLLLTACNMPITPTPHPTPTQPPAPTADVPAASGGACLTGTWQISNLSEYLNMALPQMIEGATVKVGEVSGNLTYTFNEDSTTVGKAQDFKIQAQVTTNGVSLPGQISVNGSSTGSYQVDDNQGILTLTGVKPGDLTVNATVAGIPVVKDQAIGNLLDFGSSESGSGSTNYQCIGNTLKISIDVPNVGPRVVILQRVNP